MGNAFGMIPGLEPDEWSNGACRGYVIMAMENCGLLSQAPLIPKLRGQFAEFLNNPSPVGLRIFFLSTCVGLRYGHLSYSYSFSCLFP